MAMNWLCPSCSHHVTLDKSTGTDYTSILCTDSGRSAKHILVEQRVLNRCPNPECHAYYLKYTILHGEMTSDTTSYPLRGHSTAKVASFTVLPEVPQPLSATVPKSVYDDYVESYRIRELSPKASATLSRRALQGMVRDFWGVSKSRLADELKAIEDRCDPLIYQAVMGLKSIGNIGAHPERDINLIFEVDEDEAEELLGLLRQLDQEWYVHRAARNARLASLAKMQDKKGSTSEAPAAPAIKLVAPE